MIGTVFNRNVLHRLGDAINAWKGLPTPSQLYPPQINMQGGFISFPGWERLEREGGARDERNVRKALQSPTVFANVQAIANEIASAELIVKERVNDTLEDVDNHPLELLWEAPNPHMGRSFLMSYWAWSYTLASRAYLYWLPAQGEIQELWPIPPFMIRPLPSAQDFIGGYAFKARPDTDPILIPAEYITYSHSVNLFDIRDGLSFLAAAMVDINSEIAESEWNMNFFSEQNGIPDGLIGVNKDTLDSDLMTIRQQLKDFFGGTRRGVAVARATELTYTPFGRSQKDVEFKEGLNIASQRIGRAMGFPDGYWSDIANKANAEAARATMIAGAVWPLLVRLHEDMNAGVVKRWYGEQYRCEFKDIRPEDRTLVLKELDAHKTHWTIDELREADGKDPIGDVRGSMLVAELAKGIATPASKPSQMTEDYLAEQEASLPPEEEAAPPDETLPPDAVLPAQAPPIGEAPAGGGGVPEGVPEGEPVKALKACPSCGETSPDDAVFCIGCAKRFSRNRDEDIALWGRKATKALRAGKSAAVRFESTSIPADEHARISAALVKAQTATDVAQAFKATDETDSLIDTEWDAAKEWAKAAAKGGDDGRNR